MSVEPRRYYDMEKILRGQSAAPGNLPLQMLQKITKNFSEEGVLGRGGFGVVYKGVLQNGLEIAVKKVPSLLQGNNEKQFVNEVTHLMRLEHKNIVGLVGYCYNIQKILVKIEDTYHFAEEPEMLVCLEFLPGGSLEKHISDACCGLDWQTRCQIIMGICQGLHYLHDNRIIHLDLKPANILLDNDMVSSKITDFGLSRLIGPEQTRIHTSTCVGTRGYMAPEYLDKGIISIKSDIFSVGVIILEIITGHRNYPDGTGRSMQDFVEHVLQNWSNRLEELRSASLEKDYHEQIQVCIEIGLRCVHPDAEKRPTTKEIIEFLSMNLHVSDEENTLGHQVNVNSAKRPTRREIIECLSMNLYVSDKEKTPAHQVNIPEATRSTLSLERRSRMKRRRLETYPKGMEMDMVQRPATMESIKWLNELRTSTDRYSNGRPGDALSSPTRQR
ncbi:hypothetical protein ACP4OV_025336 [Aristida adscensionis]